MSGHVLVIGVDGTRFDALGSAESVRSLGTLYPVMIDEGTHSWSGPCWATIATGVPMAGILFPPASVGLIVLPVMLFHQLQLMACAVIAQRYAARPS